MNLSMDIRGGGGVMEGRSGERYYEGRGICSLYTATVYVKAVSVQYSVCIGWRPT